MIDSSTGKPLVVSNLGTAGPFIEVPARQLEAVREVLELHGIRYWVDEDLISFNEGPFFAEINFGRAMDPIAVQALLDSVP